jgi:hypothetical protein
MRIKLLSIKRSARPSTLDALDHAGGEILFDVLGGGGRC